MNLTKQPPRRPSNLGVAGIIGVARMADKARAHNEELLGDYKYGTDSGLDRDVLAFIGIEADDFADEADERDDSALSELVLERSGKSDAERNEFNTYRLEQTPEDELHERLLVERVAKYAPGRTDITTVFQSIELDDCGAFRDRDLTAAPPRTPYLRTVAGIVAAARMADKARAAKIGKVGDYKFGDDSYLDARILESLAISAGDFMEGAYANPNDTELGEWIAERAQISKGRISILNAELADHGVRTAGWAERFTGRRDEICPERPDIDTYFELMDLDDQLSFGLIDLTRQPPRSPYDRSVGGIMGLARMIDKGRAFASDNLGEYYFGNDSGFDRWTLELLALTQDEFVAGVRENSADAELIAWLGSRLDKLATDVEAHNQRLSEFCPTNERMEGFMRRAIHSLDRSRTDINTFAALSLLDDKVSFARLKAGT